MASPPHRGREALGDAAVDGLREEHSPVVQGPEEAAHQPERDDEEVVDVRQVGNEGEAHDGLHAEDLGDEEVRRNGRAHDGDDERGAELLVDLLEGKEDARERGVKGRGHAGGGAAGDQEPLLSPLAPERP